ncbi:MAG: FAD-dependent oxidoreductase [Ruminococcaceae bacterium]|nr:FAD-dependent oxidoreductase [Oscillospiraceae bacterium]
MGLKNLTETQKTANSLMVDMGRRLAATPPGVCPVELARSFVTVCHAQSCGKCVPCRIGLGQLSNLLLDVIEGRAKDLDTIDLIKNTAQAIHDSADCAIGFDAARIVLTGIENFRDDYEEHILHNRCKGGFTAPVPCTALCPANVDVPGYISLINAGRNADAVRLIRKDNPLPVACGYICEHPCETHCRRNLIDYALNIRALKRYAVDNAGIVPAPLCDEPTGKKVAVIGGGPSGLTAAYYLSLMGHAVTIFEKRLQLGGMLRYGIPAYRFPRELLDQDIDAILETGIEVVSGVGVGDDIPFEKILNDYDAVYVTIGAHEGAKARIEGEDLNNVMSAVELLRKIGDGDLPNFKGKTVAVIGGGNVAMDAVRTCIRLGADNVYCVYRRRKKDMTAQEEEIEGALAEGAELLTLRAPIRIEDDGNGNACSLWLKPQIPSRVQADGRPSPKNAKLAPERLAADIIIIAVGQKTDTKPFEASGMPITPRGLFESTASGQAAPGSKVFTGGECVTGPATVIRAIAAGKTVAANIDEFLGYDHEISVNIDIPVPSPENNPPRGRVNTSNRVAFERKCDFDCIEKGMTDEEAEAESSRCLRCDSYGYGTFRGGRELAW